MIRIDLPQHLAASVAVVTATDIADDHEWLSDEEIEAATGIHLHRRRAEWVLGRIATKRLALALGLCEEPRSCSVPSRGVRPTLFLNGERSSLDLSISHSGEIAAAAIASHPVGIDIQLRRSIDPRSTRFFLRDEEESLAGGRDAETLLDLWSAKEAALKAGGVQRYRQVELREDENTAATYRFTAGEIEGEVETVWLSERRLILAVARGAA